MTLTSKPDEYQPNLHGLEWHISLSRENDKTIRVAPMYTNLQLAALKGEGSDGDYYINIGAEHIGLTEDEVLELIQALMNVNEHIEAVRRGDI